MGDSFIQILAKTDLEDYWTVCDLFKEIEKLESQPDTKELSLLRQIKVYLDNRKEELTTHTDIEIEDTNSSGFDFDDTDEGIRNRLDV